MTDPKDKDLEKYKITLDFLKFEATILWQIFGAFFIGNNIFIVIVAGLFKDNSNNHWLFLIAGLVGISISILWLGTFRRNSDWYRFRMGQAKEAEEKWCTSTSEDWYLLNKGAEKFANGSDIKGFKNNISAIVMISIFMLLYSTLILWSVFHLLCTCCCK